MMTSSNGNIFLVTGHFCGEFTGHRWIPRTKASAAELWCFLHLRLNKRLSKQSWGWLCETPSCSLWRHRNVTSWKYIWGSRQIQWKIPWTSLSAYLPAKVCVTQQLIQRWMPMRYRGWNKNGCFFCMRHFQMCLRERKSSFFIQISRKLVSKVLIDNKSASVQVMVWYATIHYIV